MEIKTSCHTLETCYRFSDFLVRQSLQKRYRTSCYCILNIDVDWNTQVYSLQYAQRINHVEDDFSICDLDILCMEVSLLHRISIDFHTFLHNWLDRKTILHNQRTSWFDKSHKLFKALQILLVSAIDIKMVGICCCHHSDLWSQCQERTVEFVRLNNDQVALIGKMQIAFKIL